jgi:hypothetical protein
MPFQDPARRRRGHIKQPGPRETKTEKATDRIGKTDYRQIIARFRMHGCRLCAERETVCLTAHHLDPGLKSFNIGASCTRHGREAILAELAKCICVCLNCHAKITAGIIVV